MSSKRRRLSDQDWEDRKDDIVRMFVADNLSLPKIVERLDAGEFSISKNQLEYRLKTVWGICKKVPKGVAEPLWQYVEYATRKRKSEQNKDSNVYVDGQLVNPKKLRKETARYSNQGWYKSFDQAPSPKPPSGHIISVCTPRNAGFRIVWPRNLPWLVSSIQTIRIKPHGFVSHESDYIQALLPGRSHGESKSDTKSAIEALIPELEEGEASRRADVVLSGRTNEALQEQVKVLLFKVSNNLMDDEEDPRAHLDPLLSIIELSGLMAKPLQLAKEDFTMLAVSENLFQTCFRALSLGGNGDDEERAIRLVIWLLKSGQSPNIVIDLGLEKATALQISLRRKMDHLAISLLDAGAHPDGYFVPGSQATKAYISRYGWSWMHPLFLAISSACESGCRDVVERLVAAGASLDWYMAAIKCTDLHNSLLSSIDPLALFIHDWTRTDAMVIELLKFVLKRAAAGPGLTKAIPNFAELGIAASEAGRKDVLEFLLDRRVDANATSAIGGTALHAAALRGHVDICRLLLKWGALVEKDDTGIPSPLHLACYHHHLDVVQLLHAHGASVRRSLDVTPEMAEQIALRFFRTSRYRSRNYYEFLLQCRLPLGAGEVYGPLDRGLIDYLVRAGAQVPSLLLFSAIGQNEAGLVSQLLQTRSSWDVWLETRIDHGELPPHELVVSPLQYAMDWRGTVCYPARDRVSFLTSDWESRVEMCTVLLGAGLRPQDGDAARAVKLGSWSLVERLVWLHVSQGSCQAVHYPEGDTLTILEAALLYGHPHITQKALELDPTQYSPGALCAATWAVHLGQADLGLVTRLLDNRLRWLGSRLPHEYSDTLKAVEATSIGLAAIWDNQELLHRLRCSLPPWDIACFEGIGKWPQHLRDQSYPEPFWHEHRFGALLNFAANANHEVFQAFVNSGFRRDRFVVLNLVQQEDVAGLQLLSQRLWSDVLAFHWQEKPQHPPLYTAVCKWNISLVRSCLDLGEDINQENAWGQTPLLLAVGYEHLEIIKLLLGKGADVKSQSSRLLSAAINGNTMEVVDLLIEKGADIKPQSSRLLSTAIRYNNMEVFDLLIEKGADVNSPATGFFGTTALQAACIYGHLGLAKRLIDLRVDINAPGAPRCGRTALEGAAQHGRIDFIQLLLSEGAETTGDHRRQYARAIFLASREGHMAAVGLLKKHREWTAEDEEMLKHAKMTFDCDDEDWSDAEYSNESSDADEYDSEVEDGSEVGSVVHGS